MRILVLLRILLHITAIQSFPIGYTEERSIPSYISDASSSLWNKTGGAFKSGVQKLFVKMIEKTDDTCESNGSLKPTVKGFKDCKKKCHGLPQKIQETITMTFSKVPKFMGNGRDFTIEINDDPELPDFKCVPNVLKSGFICTCPRAPKLLFKPQMQQRIINFLLQKGSQSGELNFFSTILLLLLILSMSSTLWTIHLIKHILITAPLTFLRNLFM